MIKVVLFVVGMFVCGCSYALPSVEMQRCKEVARWYKLTPEQTALLMTIRRVEQGAKGKEFGVLNRKAMRHKDGVKSFYLQARFAAETIKWRYTGDIDAFAARWAPRGVDNDPTDLNRHWARNAKHYLERYRKVVGA